MCVCVCCGNPLRSLTLMSAINPALFLLKNESNGSARVFIVSFIFAFFSRRIISSVFIFVFHSSSIASNPTCDPFTVTQTYVAFAHLAWPGANSLCGRVPPVSACHALRHLPGHKPFVLRPLALGNFLRWQQLCRRCPAPFSLLLLISEIRWKLIDCSYDLLRLERVKINKKLSNKIEITYCRK